ncbi:ATP-binding protein [Rhodobacterales bacterium HKCCE2091]|nr:ATP-binding protein [Rhodobacterales bacterium HKCCE2091]
MPAARGTTPPDDDGDPPILRLDPKPDPVAIRVAMAELRRKLARHAPGATVERAELVIAEVLNNIAEHGFDDGAAGDETISVSIRAGTKALSVTVTDTGRGMPGGMLPLGHLPPVAGVPADALPEGGFGWNLIRRLTTDLRYVRSGGTNRLTFRIGF